MTKPTIVFDLGGVLLDWDRRYLFNKMFEGRHEEMAYFLDHVCTLPWNHQMDEGRDFSEAVAAKIAEFPAYEPYIIAYQTRWPEMIAGPIDGTVEILTELRRAGYPISALSNWPPGTFPIMQQRYDFLNWFEVAVLSNEHKVAKPDPAIYRILLGRLGRPASDCFFIDDRLDNVVAATALGFRAIRFESPDQLRSELIRQGVSELRRLTQVG